MHSLSKGRFRTNTTCRCSITCWTPASTSAAVWHGASAARAWAKPIDGTSSRRRVWKSSLRTARGSVFVPRFTLAHPHAHTIIAGTGNPAHLRDNVEAVLKGQLTDDVYAEAKRRLDAVSYD